MAQERVSVNQRLTRLGWWMFFVAGALVVLVALHYGVNYICNCGQITLWDWLKLLIVPAVIAGVGLWFNRQQSQRQLAVAQQRAQADALRAYLDSMTQALLDYPTEHLKQQLDTVDVTATLRILVRARTLTVLEELDPFRKRHVLRFLRESALIRRPAIVNLTEADLRGADLSRFFLSHVDLSGVSLERVNLSNSSLREADLGGTRLYGADLTNTDLRDASLRNAWLQSRPDLRLEAANLRYADLSGADLTQANLAGANLSNADLSGANLTQANLVGAHLNGAIGVTNEKLEEQAESLEGATMPDGSKHD